MERILLQRCVAKEVLRGLNGKDGIFTRKYQKFRPKWFLHTTTINFSTWALLIKTCFLTGLEKSSSIWLFSSNEWALGRAMHEMSYFPRKFPPQLSCCCCPKGWLQALPRIRGGGHHTHEYKKAKRFQKILCRAVVTYKRRPLTSNCKSSIVVFIHT